jgi:L-alanine-DL-glutamate epimerase-like enolase superfamily enzyme
MKIERLETAVYKFPTPEPEADGTFEWSATTAVVVHAHAGGVSGLGWTYSTGAAAHVVAEHLADAVTGNDVDDVALCWQAMHRACRNLGTRGLVMQALSAVDVALWDLKARAHEVSLAALFGRVHPEVAIYGSGGFTTMSDDELTAQVEQWRDIGCRSIKIKIGESWGSRIGRDLKRVERIRELAPDADAMVDANGGYTRAQARRVGAALDELGVVWFEEPVSSDDVEGLAAVRAAVRCDVAAGEYAADVYEAARLCPVVDCLQLDATRCGGYTGFLRGAALAASHNLDVSGHCAPALHAPVVAAIQNLRHVEYFADHARLEPQLLTGVPTPRHGTITPNAGPGHGYELHPEAERFQVAGDVVGKAND